MREKSYRELMDELTKSQKHVAIGCLMIDRYGLEKSKSVPVEDLVIELSTLSEDYKIQSFNNNWRVIHL